MFVSSCDTNDATFYKDVFVPPYSIVFTPSAITCANPCVAMSPSSTSTVPVSFTFTSPPPTQTATTSGALFCIPGTYTMTYQNQLNGCLGVANTVVPVNSPCGVNEINLNNEISIAPNPSNGKFNIVIKTATTIPIFLNVEDGTCFRCLGSIL